MKQCHDGRLRAFIVAIGLLIPTVALSDLPAFESRAYTVHLKGSAQPVLDALNKASTSVGLHCVLSDTVVRIQCEFRSAGHDVFRGLLDALDETEDKTVIVRAYAHNVDTPKGEVDPVIDKALHRFFKLLSKNTDVESVEQCVGSGGGAPRCSELKIHR
jgi:hypothetical protein